MRIKIRREDLLKPLGSVAGVVERRQALPILANVLMQFRDGCLTLTGTDLEVEMVARVEGVAGEPGQATLPARKLVDICRALPAGVEVDLRLDGEKAVLRAGSGRFTLLTLPATEFPSIETASWEQSFSLPQGRLRHVLEKTHFSMAQQDVRYYLNGLLLELGEQRLRAVATDGHRLALGEVEVPGLEDGRQVIVPRKGVMEILRLLEDGDQPVQIQLSANHLRVGLERLTFTSKLIDGRFPDYGKVIPQSHVRIAELPREAFRETLSRVAILSNEKYRGARLRLSDGMMSVSAHNPEQEEAQEDLVVRYQGDEIEIGFNISYLQDAVEALASDEVELGLNDPNSSCTIMAPTKKDYLYVVMPMRL